MKLTTILVFVSMLQVSAIGFSQNQKVSVSLNKATLKELFSTIEKQTNFKFLYRDDILENIQVSMTETDLRVDDLLAKAFQNSRNTFKIIENNLIVIAAKDNIQKQKVTGIVTDASNGDPIIGANVLVEGTTIGVVTDINGKFSLEIPKSDAVLVVSFLGYNSDRISVNGQTVLDIKLIPDIKKLDEVVVIGYGSQKKKDVTGAVAIISSKELEDRPNSQFGYSLEGKAAGVQVIRSSGQPQAGFSIKIRGTSSITSGSEPLYIVDGVQTYDTNEINPADIESFTVLKDASSAAIYGSSGSNGVVLITTKRGKNQKTKVEFNTSVMTSQAWKKMKVLNSAQFKALATELGLSSIDWSYYNADTNWQDEIFRNALTQNYQLSVTGGNDKTNYYISGSTVNQQGIVLNNSVKRATFKINLDHKVSDFFKVGTSLSYDQWTDVSVTENDRNGVITRLLTTVPIIGIWDKQSPDQYAVNPYIPDLENPYSTVYQPDQKFNHNRFHGNAFGELSLLPNLKFKSLLGVEHSNGIYTSFQNPTQTSYGRSMDGLANETDNEYNYWVSENTLNFTKKISDHDFALLAGFVTSKESSRAVSIGSHGFGGSTAITTVTPGTVQSVPQVSIYAKSHAAFIGRLNYSYKEKYLLTSNFRADGSGQFSSKNRWGYFPSFSAGWRISNEDFFRDVKVVNDLKIRAGWGIVGNDNANPYAWFGLVNPAAYVIGGSAVNAYAPNTLENNSLRWEKTAQFNVGLDIGLLDNRISIITDYYKKKTTDLLLYVPIPASVGVPGNTALQNAGSLQNQGFEFQINSKNYVGDKFKWSTDFNINFNRSKVLDIVGTTIHSGAINPAGTTYNLTLVKAGLPLGSFYGYISDGVDPATGNIKYRDIDGADANGKLTGKPDGKIDDSDKTIIGNANPKFTYGLSNSFSYKDFSLDIFLQGVQGNDVFNATKILTESMRLGMNQSANVLNRWEKPGDITDVPKAIKDDVTNSEVSSRYIENGSYLRVKSVTLGYNLPKSLIEKLKISRIMVYVTAENLLTLTKYSGFDPEVSAFSSKGQDNTSRNTSLGVDYGTYPQSRDFVLGLNITF
jgi:TonB-linked SusC/RagA family outer membrane protein